MRIASTILIFLCALLPTPANATVDYCAVNTQTGDAYLFEEDDYAGIGWVAVSERDCNEFESFAAAHGHRLTSTPHKIELTLLVLIAAGALITTLLLFRRRTSRTKFK
jgi:hypothetical protein